VAYIVQSELHVDVQAHSPFRVPAYGWQSEQYFAVLPLLPQRARLVAMPQPSARVIVIDNYDSFVYNLVQYIGSMGWEPIVVRNDQATRSQLEDLAAQGVVISPGPGRPEEAGLGLSVIEWFKGKLPIFGVCLGLQCMAVYLGARVVRGSEVVHGKTSHISHDGKGVFKGLPSPFIATRYHSLVVERESLPSGSVVSAWSEDGTVMGLRTEDEMLEGVQFHPESVLSEHGMELLENFLLRCKPQPSLQAETSLI